MDDNLELNLFSHPYIDMLWYLQDHITNDKATYNNMNFTLDDFCYKPISGEGCIVESAMQYFLNNKTILDTQGATN